MIGFVPLLGDAVYGAGAGPLHLLARAIRLPLDPSLAAVAPVPPHMQAALRRCGWAGRAVRWGVATAWPGGCAWTIWRRGGR